VNGQAIVGTWEYRQASKRLLINRVSDNILLQNGFFSNALLVLKKSGSEDPGFILVNREKIPDLNYVEYLNKQFVLWSRNEDLPLSTGQSLNGTFPDPNRPGRYQEYQHGKVVRSFSRDRYATRSRVIFIEQESSDPFPGDPVFTEDKEPAPDSVYFYNTGVRNYKIRVVNGKVYNCEIKKDDEGDYDLTWIILGLVISGIIVVFLASR
jgi:hypothetical protein